MVCQELKNPIWRTTCGHDACDNCWQRLVFTSTPNRFNCPLCRKWLMPWRKEHLDIVDNSIDEDYESESEEGDSHE